MNKENRPNWRRRVLDRLDEMRSTMVSAISTEELEMLYQVADKFDPNNIFQENEINEEAPVTEVDKGANSAQIQRILSASCSYVQKCSTPDVPFHIQIIVPSVSGTSAANPQQLYEVAVWERCLLQIFCEAGCGLAFFEYCSGMPPLTIDVFASPTYDDRTPFYWKSALETETFSEIHEQIIQLRSRSMKGVFPPNRQYIAVTFDEGVRGLGKIWEGGREEPRQMAIDVVANMWTSYDEQPPTDLEERIKSYDGWPK